MQRQFAPIAYAAIIALATILAGTLVASIVGMSKDTIAEAILLQARTHAPSEQAAHATVHDALSFLRRMHTHAQGLGVTALVVALLLAHTGIKPVWQRLLSLGMSLGAASYSFCLLYVGVFTGAKGKVAAVADMHYLAMGGVTVYGAVIGVLIAGLACYHLGLLWPIRFVLVRPRTTSEQLHQPARVRPSLAGGLAA